MANHIAQLKNMFPDIDEESIRSVLARCRNDVNGAIEKLLTFSEDIQKAKEPAEKRSHAIQQYRWMNLPPLTPAKQDSNSLNEFTSAPPQWKYPYTQPVATSNKSSSASSSIGMTTSTPVQPVVKQSPWQQTLPTHCSHQHAKQPAKKLILMRGLPGSGKSTLARKLKGQTGAIFSTDDYYMVDGVYRFDASRLGEYHAQNQQRAKDAMRRGISPIIIDNTNTKCHEMKPYVSAALQFNYTVEFREPDTPWKFNISTLAHKNVHGVNKVVLERMLDRYEHRVTIDMVMGTNRSGSKSTVPNRDGYSAPSVNSSKAGGFLIARSPVTIPTTQPTSPNLKMKKHSHGNQANSWHGNHHLRVSQNDKGNWLRRDDNSHPTTSQLSTNNDISNDNLSSVTSHSNNNSTHSSGLLTIDTSQYDTPIQTISSPQSAEVVQQCEHNDDNHSYPLSDLVYARTQPRNHNLHHSLSDSVIPIGAHHFSNEPFRIVPRNSDNVEMSVLYRAGENTSIALANQDNINVSRKWPSTELYHDSDDDFSGCLATEHTSSVTEGSDGQTLDNDSNNIVTIDTNSLTELVGIDNDVDFLKSCFPNILADQVSTVYNDCEHNVEAAVAKLLQLPTSSVAVEELNEVSQRNEEVRLQEESSNQSDVVKEIVVTEDVPTTSVDEDEKVARALQDQLDKAFMEKSSTMTTNMALQSHDESSSVNGYSVHEDEGLLFHLPPSLARKLQDMFGSVKEHLVTDGEPSGDDLLVLLSEKAAKEIYKKWLDTLKAKQIETTFNNSVQLRKDGELARQLQREEGGQLLIKEDEQITTRKAEGQWKREHRSKQRNQTKSNGHLLSTKPSISPSLKDIIQQQGLVEQESQQVSEIVLDACKNSMVTHIKVQELYHNFPSLNQHYIDQLILEHQFNFDQVSSELQRRQARKPISVVANPSVVSKLVPAKMSPRKHETTTAANDGPVVTASSNTRQEPWNDPSYEEIRAEAAVHARLRAESFQKAAEARSKKQGDLAVFYAQQGHLHTNKMNDANERAAEMIMAKSNASNSDVIDFHGLFVKEALEVLEEKLLSTTKKTIFVVTGKGSHSSGGVARIKPAVIDYLDRKGYRHETVNEGQIKIFINN